MSVETEQSKQLKQYTDDLASRLRPTATNPYRKPMSVETTCQWCGKDCEFMRLYDGLCISCGDKMQKVNKLNLIDALAKATVTVAKLRLQIKSAQERGFDI